jgi:AcrR family transcriptional regulator
MHPDRRQALLQAMLDELAANGYEEASVGAALGASGVSAEEFEAEFPGKDECLFAAYEDVRARIVDRVKTVCGGSSDWPTGVKEGLRALLDEIAERPATAHVMTRAFPAIRPAAYRLYVEFTSDFVPLMRGGREYAEVDGELPGEVELLAVGAAESLIFAEVDAGRAERLPRMLPEILFSVLVPFMGPDRAGEEMRGAAAVR